MVEGATLAMDKQITYVILLFTKASTLTAGFLRQAIQWNLQQSQFPYVFWHLEWDQYKPLDPKMFGGLGTNKAARFYIYLVCSNTPNSAMGEFCEGRWPPTRQFFQTFMTIAMHKLVASSHNSRFCALLHEEAYLPNPQPLWSLYNYATRGSFASYILLEPTDLLLPAEILASLALMPTDKTHKSLVQAMAQTWSNHLLNNGHSICTVTFIAQGELPITLQDASPHSLPFGTKLSQVDSSCDTCGANPGWDSGYYHEETYIPLCSKCLQNGLPVRRPIGTRLFEVSNQSEPIHTAWAALSARYANSDDQDKLLTGIL
ncbi:hypothetical protein RSAG8_08514, partial [Rhizoctonia solani AG-8 WAC10335]